MKLTKTKWCTLRKRCHGSENNRCTMAGVCHSFVEDMEKKEEDDRADLNSQGYEKCPICSANLGPSSKTPDSREPEPLRVETRKSRKDGQ